MQTHANTADLYDSISQILLEARQKAYASINSEMVMAYWQIGKRTLKTFANFTDFSP
jgi:hypothetical protein